MNKLSFMIIKGILNEALEKYSDKYDKALGNNNERVAKSFSTEIVKTQKAKEELITLFLKSQEQK